MKASRGGRGGLAVAVDVVLENVFAAGAAAGTGFGAAATGAFASIELELPLTGVVGAAAELDAAVGGGAGSTSSLTSYFLRQ